MSVIKIDSYSVNKSKSGHYTPVINGIHIHSSYNPNKEALSFIEKNEELILDKPNLLILGLGFGYHVNLAARLLKQSSHTPYHIVVIEPNKRTHSDCRNLNLIDQSGCIIHSGQTIKELYSNRDLIDFLLKSPSVLAHPSSFNLYSDYFREFLGYRSPRDLATLKQNFSNEWVQEHFDSIDSEATIDSYLGHTLPNKKIFDKKEDHLLMAFRNLTKARSVQQESK